MGFAPQGRVTTQGRRQCKETEAQRGGVAEPRIPGGEPPAPAAAFVAPTPEMERARAWETLGLLMEVMFLAGKKR